jgi:TolB-like protein
MKPHRLLASLLCVVLCAQVARAQDIDSELTKLTEDLAGKIKANGNKKVTVLDFTDLQGAASELGKYIAEQLTVDFVMTKRDFAVLDRANLKSILAEHKLTATGLVDPENAKQLGKFAGVDALVIGNIIPIGTNINLTVKIITTETAEVVGAAKAKFKSDDTVQQFLTQPAKASDSTGLGQNAIPNTTKKIGNFCLTLDNIVKLDDGSFSVGLTIQNKSAKNSIAVAMYHDVCYMQPCALLTSMTAGDGTQFNCDDSGLIGIRSTRFSPLPLTEIEPNGEKKVSIRFGTRGTLSETVTTITFQSEFVVNQNYNAHAYDNYRLDQNTLPPNCKIENVVLEIPVQKR